MEEQILGNWKQIKGKLKEKLGKLTEDDILQAKGKRDILAGLIQERYGKTKDESLKALNDFFKTISKE